MKTGYVNLSYLTDAHRSEGAGSSVQRASSLSSLAAPMQDLGAMETLARSNPVVQLLLFLLLHCLLQTLSCVQRKKLSWGRFWSTSQMRSG